MLLCGDSIRVSAVGFSGRGCLQNELNGMGSLRTRLSEQVYRVREGECELDLQPFRGESGRPLLGGSSWSFPPYNTSGALIATIVLNVSKRLAGCRTPAAPADCGLTTGHSRSIGNSRRTSIRGARVGRSGSSERNPLGDWTLDTSRSGVRNSPRNLGSVLVIRLQRNADRAGKFDRESCPPRPRCLVCR